MRVKVISGSGPNSEVLSLENPPEENKEGTPSPGLLEGWLLKGMTVF